MEMKSGPRRLARKLTYANVVATLALMIAISGGTALAATHLITGKQIAKGTISATNNEDVSVCFSMFVAEIVPLAICFPVIRCVAASAVPPLIAIISASVATTLA